MSKANGSVNGSAAATEKPAAPKCHLCGKTWPEPKDAPNSRNGLDYERTAAGVICKDRASCRGRQMHAEMDKRGIKRWSPHTQEELLAMMDCPPKDRDPKNKWESIHDIRDRVLAAIEFFSTCYPICLLYAVQVDEDGEPIRENGSWKRHTHRSLADILGIHQSQVTRAVDYWLKRHIIWVDADDGAFGIELQPKSLFPNERDACTRISETDLNDLRALLPSTLKVLDQLRQVCQDSPDLVPPDAYTQIAEVASTACTQINAAISEARTRWNKAVLDACEPFATLLSRTSKSFREKRTYVSANGSTVHEQPQTPPQEGGRQNALNQLPAPVAGPTPAEVLHERLPRIQDEYQGYAIAAQRFSLGKADRILCQRILDGLEGQSWTELQPRTVDAAEAGAFLDYAENVLRTKQSPRDPRGPKSLAFLIELAKGYARGRPQRQHEESARAAAAGAATEREAAIRANAAAEEAFHARLQETWAALPQEAKEQRLRFARATLKAEPRWHRISPDVREREAEAWALKMLAREIETQTAGPPRDDSQRAAVWPGQQSTESGQQNDRPPSSPEEPSDA